MFRRLLASPRLRWQVVAVLVSVVLVWTFSVWTQTMTFLERKAQDLLLNQTGQTSANVDPDVILVALDETSMNLTSAEPEEIAQSRGLQLMTQAFPFSREVYALAAEKLLAAGARIVIFDFVFPSPREGDDAFAEQIRASDGRIIFGSNFNITDEGVAYINPAKNLETGNERNVGFVNFPRVSNSDAIVRAFYPYATPYTFFEDPAYGEEKPLPALSTAAALRLGFAPPLGEKPELLRFPYLKLGSIREVSLYELFVPKQWERNLKNGEIFRDKIVLVGPTAPLLHDFHPTPLGQMPGPLIHLNILSAIKRGVPWYHTAPDWVAKLSVPLAGLLIFLLSLNRRNVAHFIGGWLALIAIWIAVFWAAFAFGHWFLPLIHPLATLFLSGFAALAVDVSLERRERGRLRGTLERYVSKNLVKEIVDNPDSYLQRLGGQRRDIVALFCDLKGFTSDAETMDPAEMVRLLNEYFTEMVDVVFQHGGTLDKFLGDALMSTWGGVSDARPDADARAAVEVALQMKERHAALNARWKAQGLPSWQSGIGICQGPAVFGNIGSHEKMDPTVIGDTVNLASRVEGLTRMYGCGILMDERVASHAQKVCGVLLVDIARVKGRQGHEAIFHPFRDSPEARTWCEAFNEARSLYVAEEFENAREKFLKLEDGGLAPKVAECFRLRCEAFLRTAPPEGWDGIWTFTEK